MLEYIKNILPRLAVHSKDLNRKENFVEKRWVLLDTDNNVHEYFFKRDGTLRLFVNGNGTTGNWEMLDQGRRIMVEFGSEAKLLQAAFVNEGLFLLKKSSSNELAFALFDPDVIAASDIENYIETFFSTPEKQVRPPMPEPIKDLIYETDKGQIKILITKTDQTLLNKKIFFIDTGDIPENGRYRIIGSKQIAIIYVKHGKVDDIITQDQLDTRNGILFTILIVIIIIFIAYFI